VHTFDYLDRLVCKDCASGLYNAAGWFDRDRVKISMADKGHVLWLTKARAIFLLFDMCTGKHVEGDGGPSNCQRGQAKDKKTCSILPSYSVTNKLITFRLEHRNKEN
jgi:hypothetical protein